MDVLDVHIVDNGKCLPKWEPSYVTVRQAVKLVK
jgi:hypothetical protein